ncbi:hypothetical protein LZG04_16995 [Saccharothrix sp. S26]|uniref:hypothetical protein n=1 Tax=Saccharothrix sp. S26 TaxID=2907215 RepID=UPI001F3461DD|nr:hypothetical protein [Saccharothrix sp. S26]MCE6996484.1 hypothetical protein [Saccharothrix sp. S26]
MAGGGFVEVHPAGRGPNVVWRVVSVVIAGVGPVIAAFGYGDDGIESGQLVVGGVLSLFLVPVGIGVWRGATRARRRLLRLDAVGLPATGLVLATRSDGGEMPEIVVTVRISGPDVPAFDTTVTVRFDPVIRPGYELTVLVDPDDGTFLIRDFDDADFVPGS